jgi:threonine synthase
MQYYSLARVSPAVDFRTAAVSGQAPDGGLYFPSVIPSVSIPSISLRGAAPTGSLADVAFSVMEPFVSGSLSPASLREIVSDALSFDIPLVPLSDDLYVLELFHGPTLAFKDVGARFMSRCLAAFSGYEPVTVLVATSGDTGGAVASGFDGVPGVRVVILYPRGRVSPVQELQLTTCGENVSALEVDGTFDDCQRMVKQAFADASLQGSLRLTSANSINVARWLPQQIYYWWALQHWPSAQPPVFIVPSGNFGNLCAGMLAHRTGMPAAHFVAACNANDTIPRFLSDGVMDPHPAVATLSNAMDVAVPSNFGRILEMFAAAAPSRAATPPDATPPNATLRANLSAISLDDAATIGAIRTLYEDFGYIADPHTAVGFGAWEAYRRENPAAKGVLLATAHPVKFAPTIEAALGLRLDLPGGIRALLEKPSRKVLMGTDFAELKDYLCRGKEPVCTK